MPKAALSNYLWIPKSSVKGTPEDFAAKWQHKIKLLDTPEGRQLQQQISAMNESMATDEEPDLKNLTNADHLTINAWTETEKAWALCAGDLDKVRKLIKKLKLKVKDKRVSAPWPEEMAEKFKLLMTPRPHQVEPFQEWMKARHGIFNAAPAFGKAQPVDEVVLTPTGFLPIGSLQVGDQVIGSNGEPCNVTGVFPQGVRPVRVLRFSDGASVRADADHLWAVKNSSDLRRAKPWRILTTQQIEETVREPCGEANWRVPLVEVQGSKSGELPLDPYVLGALIGDGCLAEYLGAPLLTSVDEEIVQAVNDRLPYPFRCRLTQDFKKNKRASSYRISRAHGSFKKRKSEVREALKSLGLWGTRSNTKFIPQQYLSASVDQRKQLLMGLMDTDGWAKGSQLSTASERLAHDVAQLVRSLGGTARLTKKKTSYVYKGENKQGQDAYMVTMKLSFTPFLLERKRKIYERRARLPTFRKIVAVEDGGTAECVCISVDAPDQLYVTKDYVVTHNTFIMCWMISELKQNTVVLVPTDMLAEQFITRFRHGSGPDEKGNYLPVTNCAELEEELGYPLVGRYKTGKDLYPVTVATWQSFSSKGGKKALKEVSKRTGVVLADECHMFAAPVASSVINGFHAKYKMGVTATVPRKDKLHKVLFDVLGPVTAVGRAPQLPLVSTLIATGSSYKMPRYPRRGEWAYMLNHLVKQASRNDLIHQWVEYDYNQGRNILLLCDRRQWCIDVVEQLNRKGIPAKTVLGGMTSKKGQAERDKTIAAMMDGDIAVIAATQVFKQGVDIPCLDTMYGTCPMSNKSLLEQMVGRIRRVYDDKQPPVFRYFVDDGNGQLVGCARGTHKHLTELGSSIVLVPVGVEPGQVVSGDGYVPLPKKKGLRGASRAGPLQVEKLFEDLSKVSMDDSRYNERMKGKKR